MGAGCGVALGAAFPWQGKAGAALGGGVRPVAPPGSVWEEEEGAGWARWLKCRVGRWGCWADWAED
jgi:hypothetical protein